MTKFEVLEKKFKKRKVFSVLLKNMHKFPAKS